MHLVLWDLTKRARNDVGLMNKESNNKSSVSCDEFLNRNSTQFSESCLQICQHSCFSLSVLLPHRVKMISLKLQAFLTVLQLSISIVFKTWTVKSTHLLFASPHISRHSHAPMARLLVPPLPFYPFLIPTYHFIFTDADVYVCSVQIGYLVPLNDKLEEDTSIPNIPLNQGPNYIGRHTTASLSDKRLSRKHLTLTASPDASSVLAVVIP